MVTIFTLVTKVALCNMITTVMLNMVALVTRILEVATRIC